MIPDGDSFDDEMYFSSFDGWLVDMVKIDPDFPLVRNNLSVFWSKTMLSRYMGEFSSKSERIRNPSSCKPLILTYSIFSRICWIFLISDWLTLRRKYPARLLPPAYSEDWRPWEAELGDIHRPGGRVAEAQDVPPSLHAPRLVPGVGQDQDLILRGQPDTSWNV